MSNSRLGRQSVFVCCQAVVFAERPAGQAVCQVSGKRTSQPMPSLGRYEGTWVWKLATSGTRSSLHAAAAAGSMLRGGLLAAQYALGRLLTRGGGWYWRVDTRQQRSHARVNNHVSGSVCHLAGGTAIPM